MDDDTILKSALSSGSDCPALDVLSGLLAQPESSAYRRTAEQHLVQCASCRTEIALLRSFEEGRLLPSEVADVQWIESKLLYPARPKAPSEGSFWKWLWSGKAIAGVAVTAVVLMLAVGLSTQLRRGNPMPDFGPGDGAATLRSRSLDASASPTGFEWKSASGASQYELTVKDVTGAVIFDNSFTSQTLAYPPVVATTVSRGMTVFWEVIAKDAAGNEIARSGVKRFAKSEAPK